MKTGRSAARPFYSAIVYFKRSTTRKWCVAIFWIVPEDFQGLGFSFEK
jgi:hypothetical protein